MGILEALEPRDLLAADYLHSFVSRPGAPESAYGLGNSLAMSAEYHVAGHIMGGYSPEAGFAGEVQIHDADTGELLRTIVNPDPEDLYVFGHSVAIAGNLLVIGAIGRGEPNIIEGELVPEGPYSDLSGRAYLYDADTGTLLHTFNGIQTVGDPYDTIQDNFGHSVAIAGDSVIVGAPGAYIDINSVAGLHPFARDPGRVYVFSASTGELVRIIQNPEPSIAEGFGLQVAASGGRLLVASPFDDNDGEISGAAYLFDVSTGNLVREFDNPDADVEALFGGFVAMTGDTVVIGGQVPIGTDASSGIEFTVYLPRTYVYDADNGDLIRTIESDPATRFSAAALSGSLLISTSFPIAVPFEPGVPIAYIHDITTGNLVDTVLPAPQATFARYSSFAALGDRLLISNFRDNSERLIDPPDGEVWVYSLGTAPATNPPTDIALAGNTVVENAANGTIVGTLTATDADPGENFTFTLLNSAGGRFAINGNQLVVANGNSINHETNPALNVTVRVTDSQSNTYSETFTIQVTDVNEPITDLFLLDGRVVEHAPDGSLVGAIDNPSPIAQDRFSTLAASDTRLLVTSTIAPMSYILDAATHEVLHTLLDPNPSSLFFSRAVLINDSYAVVSNPFDNLLGSAAGAVHIYDVATGALIRTFRGSYPLDATFGYNVAFFEGRLAVGAPLADYRVLIYDVATGDLLHTLIAPSTSNANFGIAIAMDGERIVVGQPGTATGTGAGAGAVHVYSATTGLYLDSIDNPSPASQDLFGQAIRMVGDRILVGAPRDDTAAIDAGAAYLFDAETGTLLHTFLPTGADTVDDEFGFALDFIAGRIAIGSAAGGRVDLYDATTYELIQELPDVHFGPQERFGVSLAFGGDRLYVGDHANRGAAESGEIQVFDATTGDLTSGFRPVDQDESDTYTYTLLDDAGGRFALVGNQLVVANGAALDHATAASHTVTVQVTDSDGHTLTKVLTIGVIKVVAPPTDITLSGGTIAESSTRIIHNLRPEAARQFGKVLAISGNRMLVSDLDATNPATRPGRVAVIDLLTGKQLTTLVAPNPVANATSADGLFGHAAAIAGNLAAVAAPMTDLGAVPAAGVVYLFDMTTGNLVRTLTMPATAVNPRFGITLAASGNRLAVGSLNGSQSAGVVYLFDAPTGTLLATIPNPHPDAGLDLFGSSLALSGDTLVIAAPNDDAGAADSGRAYLYHFDPVTSAPSLIATLDNPSPASQEHFGRRVTISGDRIAISASDGTGAQNAGAVYIYDAGSGALLRTIPHPSPVANDDFGLSSAFLGPYLIIGSRVADVGNIGRAYVIHVDTGQLVTTFENPSFLSDDNFAGTLAADGSLLAINDPNDNMDGNGWGVVHVHDLAFGQTVGTLSTIDPDAGETFTYQLLDNAGGRFAISGNTIVVADATKIDFETATSHSVTVLVTDSGGGTFVKTFTIAVSPRNEPPRNILFGGPTFLFENPANGTIIATLSTSDPDTGEAFTYQLLDDAGGRFAISGNTIVVANGALLDFETAGSHVVTVRAFDAGGLFVTEVRTITVLDVADTFDFGDLPDSYGTTLASNGARHMIGGGLRLGGSVTIDADGPASPGANTDAGDDGVALPFLLIPGVNATFTVSASMAGRLDAFIDFNGNGTFEAGERVTAAGGRLLAAGANTVTIMVPPGAVGGNLAARFRLSSQGGLEAIGAAADGEVEDYRVTVANVTPYSATVVPDPDAPWASLLLVNGTDGADVIVVRGMGGNLRTRINGAILATTPSAVTRIVILGGPGDDRIRIERTAIAGYIDGGAGNDAIIGGNGSDWLIGGEGDDRLEGRGGSDVLMGGLGNDVLIGGAGIDYLFGEDGNDRLIGRGVLLGGAGIDFLSGRGTRNVLIGGGEGDRLGGRRPRRGNLIINGSPAYASDLAALRVIYEEWALSARARARIGRLNKTMAAGFSSLDQLTASTAQMTEPTESMVSPRSIDLALDDWTHQAFR